MNRLNLFRLAASALVVASATGCATMTSGVMQRITVESNPPGAHVKIGMQTGTTPVSMLIRKGKDDPVEITFGRAKQIVQLNRTVDPAAMFNIIPPLWPGFIVDAMTGALTVYEPDAISVDFRHAQTVRYHNTVR